MGVIYGVSCTRHPSEGVRYVGQTSKSLKSRRGVHLWHSRTPESRSYNSHFSNWIRKHSEENIEFSVLEECDEYQLDGRERDWIAALRGVGKGLTNIRPGGASERGYKNPKQSEAMRGSKNPMYGKDRRELMRYARSFQKPMAAENRARVGARSRGELNVKAKLTEQDVREIRSVEKYYGVNADLGRKYGVSGAMISAIRMGKFWTHVV